MENLSLGEMQLKFAELIWENAPIESGKLVGLAAERFHWKRPTMYTVLRVLCQKKLFRNENGVVIPLLSREQYYLALSRQTIKEGFGGHLPAFVAAFSSMEKLSEEEIDELEQLIAKRRSELK
ncbi:MAG: BlaI/MecI/CopY family transcriptional regulator [Lachnospiraceae bacterium]|nr:BlaI/MecI/CopY family transcriptional regulator [Lachnospiraceae bacterium]